MCHTDTELSLIFTAGAAAGDWGQHLIRREWPGRRGLRSPISLSQRRNHAVKTASDPGPNGGFMIHRNGDPEGGYNIIEIILFDCFKDDIKAAICYSTVHAIIMVPSKNEYELKNLNA